MRAHRELNLRVRAHGGPPVLRAESSWTLHPRAPAFDSVHLFANHSSGLSVVRLELDAEIDRVSAYARCEDQGWGGTGSAGAVLALYDEAEEHVLAYSVCALTDHGTQDLRWSSALKVATCAMPSIAPRSTAATSSEQAQVPSRCATFRR